MKLTKLSRQEWEEWRTAPVTEALRDAIAAQMVAEIKNAAERYLAGRPIPEESRAALMRMQTWHEDFFTSSYDDVIAATGLKGDEQ